MKVGAIGKKIAVSIEGDTVVIEMHCNDKYLARVFYDDLIERLQKGEGLVLSLGQKPIDA